jgi:hypothetical protein
MVKGPRKTFFVARFFLLKIEKWRAGHFSIVLNDRTIDQSVQNGEPNGAQASLTNFDLHWLAGRLIAR